MALTLHQYREDLSDRQRRLAEAQQAFDSLRAVVEGLTAEVQHLGDFCDVLQANASLEPPLPIEANPRQRRAPGRKRNKKPDTEVMADLLRETGPVHVREIVRKAEALGLSFKGRGGNKTEQAVCASKLQSSSLFYNFGGNVWGLPSQQIP